MTVSGHDGFDGPNQRSLSELQYVYRRTEDLDVLREIIRVLRRAVVAPAARDTLRFQLTGALQKPLFARTGEIALLIEAVETGRAARTRDAAVGRPSHVALLSNLGSALTGCSTPSTCFP